MTVLQDLDTLLKNKIEHQQTSKMFQIKTLQPNIKYNPTKSYQEFLKLSGVL